MLSLYSDKEACEFEKAIFAQFSWLIPREKLTIHRFDVISLVLEWFSDFTCNHAKCAPQQIR